VFNAQAIKNENQWFSLKIPEAMMKTIKEEAYKIVLKTTQSTFKVLLDLYKHICKNVSKNFCVCIQCTETVVFSYHFSLQITNWQ
jgi:hypothetical protein